MAIAKCWYLGHSGFAVKTRAHTLIFDYHLDSPFGRGSCALERGVVCPEELSGENVVVFASHSHADHLNPKIFTWQKSLPGLRYVLSDEIEAPCPATSLGGGQGANLGDVLVTTLESTDVGVAFLVEVDGLCIYHAGDLNWWRWEGEPESDNEAMGKKYRAEISLLKGKRIDLAFVPVDLRQEGDYLLGIDYFMRSIGADRVVPMHFWEDYSVFPLMMANPLTQPYRDNIVCLSHRGQEF